MAFCKPSKKERQLLLKELRLFSLQWKLDPEGDESIQDIWLGVAEQDKELVRANLHWLGYCILGGFREGDSSRTAERHAIMSHVIRCLK